MNFQKLKATLLQAEQLLLKYAPSDDDTHTAEERQEFQEVFNSITDVIHLTMNLDLTAVYFCATNRQRWGKGYTPAEAKKNAGLTTKAAEKACQYYVQAAVLNEPTEDELKNLYSCITANQMHGSPEYYQHERTEEDEKMIEEKHVGWMIVEKNY